MIWRNIGKIIAVLLGFKLGGPFGALVGLVVGFWIDKKLAVLSGRAPASGQGAFAAAARAVERQRIYTDSVINLAAKLAKVDGVVTREEVDAFKVIFNISAAQAAAVGALYDQARQDASDYQPYAQRLATAFADMPQVLAEVLEALNRIALADGRLHPAEREFLETVATIFGMKARRFAEQAADLGDDDPYATLGVTRTASMSDIKSTWRKLSREHHPDALMAKGLPQDYIDLATKKMAAINAAYDRIRAERGNT